MNKNVKPYSTLFECVKAIEQNGSIIMHIADTHAMQFDGDLSLTERNQHCYNIISMDNRGIFYYDIPFTNSTKMVVRFVPYKILCTNYVWVKTNKLCGIEM